MKKFLLGLAAVIVLLLAVVSFSGKTTDGNLGGGLKTVLETFSGGIQVGNPQLGEGTVVTKILKGNCTLTVGGAVTASTTGAFDCPVTNAKFGDNVFVTMPTTTVSTQVGGWTFRWAGASSTNGFITVGLFNSTGANATPTAATRTNLSYLILR